MTEEKTFKCSCGKKMVIPPELVGKPLKCPRCGVRVAPAPAVTDLSSDSGSYPPQHEEEEGDLDRDRDKMKPRSARQGESQRPAKPSTSRRAKSEAPPEKRSSEDPRAARPGRETARPPRTLDVVRKGRTEPGLPRAGESEVEDPKPKRHGTVGKPKREEPAEEPAPRARETSRRPVRSETKGASDRRGAKREEEAGRSKRLGGAASRRLAAGDPESPGLIALLGLVGATMQVLVGGTLGFAALASPSFLGPAGFQVQAGTGKIVAIAFGFLFFVTGVLTELALMKYIRNVGALKAATAPAPSGRASRRAAADEDLEEDLGDADESGGDEDFDEDE